MNAADRFARLPVQAAWDRSLGTQAFRVLVAIALHVDDKTNTAYPSITLIQKLTGMKRQTVSAAIKSLEQLGYLSRSQRHASGNKTSTLYRLVKLELDSRFTCLVFQASNSEHLSAI